MMRAVVLFCLLTGSILSTGCERDADRTEADAGPTVDRPILDAEARTELSGRLDEAERRLDAFGADIAVVADSAGQRMARGLDSLQVRAAELRTELGRLGREGDEAGERAIDDVNARLDSLDREFWALRFEAAEDLETFERVAEEALATLEAEMAPIEAEIERAGDALDTEIRERWAQLSGEYVELRTDAEMMASSTRQETNEELAEARRRFGRSIALLSRELRVLAAEIQAGSDPPG